VTTENETFDEVEGAGPEASAPAAPMRSDRPQSRDSRGDNGAPRRPRRPGGKDRFAPRRKVDQFAIDGIHEVDYKDFQRLRRYISDRGKIEPRRKTGLSAFHQRSLTTAIKRARFMALLPYVSSHSR
jgi:small subunit ribosomal protein S18